MGELLTAGVRIGAARTTPQRLKERERASGYPLKPSRTYVYIDAYAGFETRVPALGDAHPDDGNFAMESYDWSFRGKDFDEVEVVASYKPQSVVNDPKLVVPDPIIVEQGSTIEVDIRRYPDFTVSKAVLGSKSLADLYDADAGVVGSAAPVPYAGMGSYLVPSIQVHVTQFYKGAPASVINLLGKLSAPPGYGGAGKWLVITGSQTKPNSQNPIGARTLVYQYSVLDWPSLFYTA